MQNLQNLGIFLHFENQASICFKITSKTSKIILKLRKIGFISRLHQTEALF